MVQGPPNTPPPHHPTPVGGPASSPGAPWHRPALQVLALAGLFALTTQVERARGAALLGLAFGLGWFGLGVSWVYISMHVYGLMPAPLAAAATLALLGTAAHAKTTIVYAGRVITEAAATVPGLRVDIKRLLLAQSLQPLPGNAPLVQAIQKHGEAIFGQPIPTCGTPLYTDVRLYCAQGIPAVIYGAGPRTVFESNAKRADEHLVLDDLRKATKVVARTLLDLMR